MNYRFLDEKIDAIRQLPQYGDCGFGDDALLGFSRALEGSHGWELVRINPFAFAEKYDFKPDETVSLFVLGARAGLFAWEWSLVCPGCGYRERGYASLRALDRESCRCSICGAEAAVRADDRLEAVFTMPPAASGEWPDSIVPLADCLSYAFSTVVGITPETDDAFIQRSAGPEAPVRFVALPPGKTARIRLGVPPGDALRLESLETHSTCIIRMKDDPHRRPAPVEIGYADAGFDRQEAFVTLALTEVALKNASRRAAGVLIGSPDPEFLRRLFAARPPMTRRACSAKFLFNNQLFRDLLRADDLPDDLSLPIDDLTILCVDMAGPAGAADTPPVRRRFELLAAVVRANRGAVVGNERGRLTASFNAPLDGARAAAGFFSELFDLAAGEDCLPKIGLHRGPAVALKAGKGLDFFGRTARIASRLPDRAGAGEIWTTEDVMRDETAAAYLRAAGYSAVAAEAALEGPGKTMKVYSWKR